MKNCPRCGKSYPDTETFCEDDGTRLTAGSPPAGGRATTVMPEGSLPAEESTLECPVCGGKAQPGEVICNFCGTRLIPDAPGAQPQTSQQTVRRRASPETFIPAHDRSPSRNLGASASQDADEEPGRRGVFGIIGFALAAVVALAVGAWFAIYLSGSKPTGPVAQSSPAPSPAASGPAVVLAKTIPLQVRGDGAGIAPRDSKTLAQVFDTHESDLDNIYSHTLESNPSTSDGILLRLHIAPDGTVSDGAVRVSTASNPSLDAEVVKAATAWKFDPAKGTGVDADYPIVMAPKTSDTASVESDLSGKIASLGPNEGPEYALSPSSAGSPVAAASPGAIGSPGATPGAEAAIPPSAPETAAAEAGAGAAAGAGSTAKSAGAAPAGGTKSHRRRHAPSELASIPHPKPPLIERVNDELKGNRKLRRVQAYTNGGNVTIFGKVFDDNDKQLAERTVRGIAGVTSVSDNLTTDVQEWQQNSEKINQRLQSAGLTGVTAKVIGNSAYLSGSVKTDLDKARAVTVAQAAAPVTVRENLIRIEPGGMFSSF
jgi:TonB family protein